MGHVSGAQDMESQPGFVRRSTVYLPTSKSTCHCKPISYMQGCTTTWRV